MRAEGPVAAREILPDELEHQPTDDTVGLLVRVVCFPVDLRVESFDSDVVCLDGAVSDIAVGEIVEVVLRERERGEVFERWWAANLVNAQDGITRLEVLDVFLACHELLGRGIDPYGANDGDLVLVVGLEHLGHDGSLLHVPELFVREFCELFEGVMGRSLGHDAAARKNEHRHDRRAAHAWLFHYPASLSSSPFGKTTALGSRVLAARD